MTDIGLTQQTGPLVCNKGQCGLSLFVPVVIFAGQTQVYVSPHRSTADLSLRLVVAHDL